jgi:hypothetical protein
MTATSGEVPLSGGHVFRWVLQGTTVPEVCGWVEKDHAVVTGTYGFYRTVDPQAAARIAASNLGLELSQ